MATKEQQHTFVTRERVIAPPDRFIFGVQDDELIEYFQEVFGSELAPALPVLHQLIEGICTADFTALRRRLQGDYEYFGAAAEARSDVDLKPEDELDQQELRFLTYFTQLMDACQYRMLSKAEWEAAQAEDFLFTLPCDVRWSAMDNKMLPRYWQNFPAERSSVPEETVDRIMVFQRGAEVATMQGTYIMLKINLLISMWLLQPIYALFVAIMCKLGINYFSEVEAPKGLASSSGDNQDEKAAALGAAARLERHPASTSIERRTFARVFPDGMSVFRKFFKKVKLQEACFRDVVILYRTAYPDTPMPVSEVDVVKEADPKFMQRNIQLRQFRGIPMADLEMLMPEKKIFVPPKVFVEMAVTLVGGLAAVWTVLSGAAKEGDGVNIGTLSTAVSLLGGRAAQVYSSAIYQKMAIEHAMGKLLYERTVGSGEPVLINLVDGVCRQRVREILICYCVLLNSQKPLSADELDAACEHFLAHHFGCKIDFCSEEALPAVLRWGMATESGVGRLTAVPLPEVLVALDGVWDSIHDFKGGLKAVQEAAARRAAQGSASPSSLLDDEGPSVTGVAGVPQTMAAPQTTAAPAPNPNPAAGVALGRVLSKQQREAVPHGKHRMRRVFQRLTRTLKPV
ncbi:hypothetical protein D9Q98_009471 [Chlorella vulgaris]|uniref:Uncharacterized protein n=1 Tax=Chlorella vulgaris TaxID=3077 RepID=A0A9D4TF68_CHLVU|nr:hypothetical protein D9Q98_009471 [Chlorella vulgaris]